MRRFLLAAVKMMLLLSGACAISASEDILFLNRGEKVVGYVTGIDSERIRVRKWLPPLPDAPPDAQPVFALVGLQREDVDRVEFGRDEEMERVVAEPAAAAARGEQLWNRCKPWLSIPKSRSAQVGIAYADHLLRSGAARKSLDLFAEIEGRAWNRADSMLARQGRLRAMVAAGQESAAAIEARELIKVSNEKSVLLQAKFILAVAGEKELRAFLEDNPRWREDSFASPIGEQLLNEVLDLYLFPALFFGSEAEFAARGLWGAFDVYRLCGDSRQSCAVLRDIVALYPASQYAREAAALLSREPEFTKIPNDETQARR